MGIVGERCGSTAAKAVWGAASEETARAARQSAALKNAFGSFMLVCCVDGEAGPYIWRQLVADKIQFMDFLCGDCGCW